MVIVYLIFCYCFAFGFFFHEEVKFGFTEIMAVVFAPLSVPFMLGFGFGHKNVKEK